MEPFNITLPNGVVVSGLHHFPSVDSLSLQTWPLVVCIPGGSYGAEYFDVSGAQSVLNLSKSLKIPVIAIDRPGYGSSTLAPNDETAPTYAQAQGRFLNSTVFPALWQEFGHVAKASAVVLLSHSIGAMMATIAAGSYTGREGYPLAGLITSGIGSELVEGPRQGMLHLLSEPAELMHFEATPKDAIMLQLPHMNLAPVDMCDYTDRLNRPVPRAELQDINTTWLDYWKGYSTSVTVPVFHGLGEFDGLWTCSPTTLDVYKSAFAYSPKVTSEMIPMAPHCMEMSFQSHAWYMKCFAFAVECTVSRSLSSSNQVNKDKGSEDALPEESASSPGGITTIVYTTTSYGDGKAEA
ncbi:Alpha/Beta hydrolase protein [Aspergillus keveii]|uniref:Alpha/Beta hydrolase protein n=1 Tax=Aspergillus keveii TaxID=714993 RepID=A0ABR4FN15_9EURO